MRTANVSLNHFLADERGYDLVEFAMAAALLGSVAVMAFRNHTGELGATLSSIVHNF